MGIVELMEEFPDIDKRINQILDQTKSSLSYFNGLFLKEDESLFGILGVDSRIKAKLTFRPDDTMSNSRQKERFIIPFNNQYEIITSNKPLSKREEGFEGILDASEQELFQIEVIFSSHYLKAKQTMEKIYLVDAKKKDPNAKQNNEILEDIIDSIGLRTRSDLQIQFRKEYPLSAIMNILEWLKKNKTYGHRGNQHSSVERPGIVCKDFCELLEALVYVSGGIAKTTEVITLNLPYFGFPYFSDPAPMGVHYVSFVFADNKWMIVDPTIYNTTFHNENTPPGLERRAIVQKLGNYHIFPITPLLYFPDMQRKPISASLPPVIRRSEMIRRGIKRKYREKAGRHEYELFPTVDVPSIQIIK